MLSPPPEDIFVGVPYGGLGEIGWQGNIIFLRDAALPQTQVTRVINSSREDPKGNVATLRWTTSAPTVTQ